jgi:hypothetical protein
MLTRSELGPEGCFRTPLGLVLDNPGKLRLEIGPDSPIRRVIGDIVHFIGIVCKSVQERLRMRTERVCTDPFSS